MNPSLQVILACLFWSISIFSRKFILISLSPIFLNFVNSLFVALLVLYFSNYQKRGDKESSLVSSLKVFRENHKLFLINALSGVTFALSLACISVELIDLSLYGLLIKLQLVFVIIIARLFLNERINKTTIPYMIVAIISAIILSIKEITSFNNSELIGVITAVLTAFFISISTVSGKYLVSKKIEPNQITTIRFALGAILIIPILPFINLIDYSNLDTKVLFWLFIGIITNAIAFIIYYRALKNIEVITASLIELTLPIFTALLGILFLSETLTLLETLASAILLYSVYKLIILRSKNQSSVITLSKEIS